MLQWLARLWQLPARLLQRLGGWMHHRSEIQNTYRRSNLHGRHR